MPRKKICADSLAHRFREFAKANFICDAISRIDRTQRCTLAYRHDGPHSWWREETCPWDEEETSSATQPQLKVGVWRRRNEQWFVNVHGAEPGEKVGVRRKSGKITYVILCDEIDRGIWSHSSTDDTGIPDAERIRSTESDAGGDIAQMTDNRIRESESHLGQDHHDATRPVRRSRKNSAPAPGAARQRERAAVRTLRKPKKRPAQGCVLFVKNEFLLQVEETMDSEDQELIQEHGDNLGRMLSRGLNRMKERDAAATKIAIDSDESEIVETTRISKRGMSIEFALEKRISSAIIRDHGHRPSGD